MGEIWRALSQGNARDRLSVLADLFAIIGVSVASVGGGVFAFLHKSAGVNIDDVVGVILVTLFCAALFVLLLAAIVYSVKRVDEAVDQAARPVRALVYAGVRLMVIALILFAVYFYYSFIVTIRFS